MVSTSKIIDLMATITLVSVFSASKASAFLHHSQIRHRGRFSSSSTTKRRIWNQLGSTNNNVDVYKQDLNNNSQNNQNDRFEGLLSSALNRAQSTLEGSRVCASSPSSSTFDQLGSSSNNMDVHKQQLSNNSPINQNTMFEGLLSSALNRAQSTMEQTREFSSTSATSDQSQPEKKKSSNNDDNDDKKKAKAKSFYKDNPAITNTALAHSLWKEILKPNQDSAIDATCGNGHDTLAMAEILFPLSDNDNGGENNSSISQLLALDIQEQACQSTTNAIQEKFGSDILENSHIEVRQTSHAPLPRPSNKSVGLVVYNLGWLPNFNHNTKNQENKPSKDCITKVESTLQSLTDAALMVRIGGMISVTTYPTTNPEEDLAVRVLLECIALLSSNVQTWRDFLDNGESLGSQLPKETVQMIVVAMERIASEGETKQTFRVSEHRKLGMVTAPILLTAVRIK